MTDCEIFPNPPIIEALIDIKVKLPESVHVETLKSFHTHVVDEFPHFMEKTEWRADFHIEKGKAPKVSERQETPIGYQFLSDNKKKIVQVRFDGFTHNHLKPYTEWNKFKEAATPLWNIYAKLVKPVSITRLSLRYINRIEIPLPFSDFKDYFLTFPEIASGVPQELANFFMRLTIPNPASVEDIALVTLTIDTKNKETEKVPFLFDIEVFRKVDMLSNDDKIWEIFDTQREYKNQIFFESLTGRTMEMFR